MRGKSIPGLKKYQGRNPSGYFQELDWPARQRAYRWLGVFLNRWGRNLTRWRFPILVGQAKRLALNPPDSAWGRSMAAKKGGYAVQRRYRAEGRHPTEKATHARLAALKVRREAERRKALGLPPASRHGFTVWSSSIRTTFCRNTVFPTACFAGSKDGNVDLLSATSWL